MGRDEVLDEIKQIQEQLNKETHYDRILRHLKDYGSITSWEAFEEYGNTRLSATIFLLRKDGWKISSNKVGRKNRYGKMVYFAEYVLDEE